MAFSLYFSKNLIALRYSKNTEAKKKNNPSFTMWTQQHAHCDIHPSIFSKHSLTYIYWRFSDVGKLSTYQEMLLVALWPGQMQTIFLEQILVTLLNT